MNKRWILYLGVLGVCLLTAGRDYWTERILQGRSADSALPFLAAFLYCFTTLIVAVVVKKRQAVVIERRWLVDKKFWVAMVGVVIFSVSSFCTYFLAMQSPLGAALNSLVNAGLDPIAMAIAGWVLVHERLDLRFFVATVLCLAGVAILGGGGNSLVEAKEGWLWGVFFSVLSSLFFGLYVAYFKILLNRGVPKWALITYRSAGISLVLLPVVVYFASRWDSQIWIFLTVLGFLGFAPSVVLFVYLMEAMNVARIGLLFFLVPVFLGIFSWLSGRHFGVSDFIATAIIFISVGYYEMGEKPPIVKEST